MSANLADRTCPTCGETFTPNTRRQIYDKDICRARAHRERKKEELAPIGSGELLAAIQAADPETARDIERVAKLAGTKFAEEILLICWRAMNRAAKKYARDFVKQDLIDSGEVKEVKRRSRKKKSDSKA